MRRADRLFQIVQLIRGRRLSTAGWLAERLEVSVRTVYRDVADLQAQGVPIEGEAGVGYRLGKGYDLPPLMFSPDEARALVAATRMAQPWLDPALASAAEDAISRVLSVLPASLRQQVDALPLWSPPLPRYSETVGRHLQQLREASEQRQVLRMRYRDAADADSERDIWPLGCFFWGQVWTLGAWCERRDDFRNFRIDRVVQLAPAGRGFSHMPGRTLKDYLTRMRALPPPPQGGADTEAKGRDRSAGRA
jgi:predicted DNA-binding transcriptional regulator YafY